jgi:hypothetical protein
MIALGMTQKGRQQKYAIEQQMRVAQMLRMAAAATKDEAAVQHYRQKVSRLRSNLKKIGGV